jgi:hypothetical protein
MKYDMDIIIPQSEIRRTAWTQELTMKLDMDITVPAAGTEIRSRLQPGWEYKKEYGGRWQVVFEIGDKDYCRESLDAKLTFEQVVSWTDQMLVEHAYKGITSAVIDWF